VVAAVSLHKHAVAENRQLFGAGQHAHISLIDEIYGIAIAMVEPGPLVFSGNAVDPAIVDKTFERLHKTVTLGVGAARFGTHPDAAEQS